MLALRARGCWLPVCDRALSRPSLVFLLPPRAPAPLRGPRAPGSAWKPANARPPAFFHRNKKQRARRASPVSKPPPNAEFKVLSFYLLVDVERPEVEVALHRERLEALGMVGRVYLCQAGINAQVSGVADACDEYCGFVVWRFAHANQKVMFNMEPVPELAFPRLRVKHKSLVAMDVDLANRGTPLSPQEWLRMLQSKDRGENITVLDIRNAYEWKLGRFKHAGCPPVNEFKDTDWRTYGLQEQDKTAKVMMYCTGGIRCEYFSAKLRQEGFKHVYQLEGGVQRYAHEVGAEGWEGKLFVFDRRTSTPVGSGSTVVVGRCIHCGVECESVRNCCNFGCSHLHIACDKCWVGQRGCCSQTCSESEHRRPWGLEEQLMNASGLGLEQGSTPEARHLFRKHSRRDVASA